MRRLKQGPLEQFRRRKCRLKNHRTLELSVLKGEGINRKTIRPQRRVLGRERTIKNLETRTSGDYSNNRKKNYLRYKPW
jgi:hypothetical protein